MKTRLDIGCLDAAGLKDLDPALKDRYLRRYREQLVEEIDRRLTAEMSEPQRQQHAALRRGPQHLTSAWLDIHLPQHRRIVAQEEAIVRARVIAEGRAIAALELAFAAPAAGASSSKHAEPSSDDSGVARRPAIDS